MAQYRKLPVTIRAIKVTAADYNPALSWDKAWDGSPFDHIDDEDLVWLDEAARAGNLKPHNRGSTDYAQWDIETLEGTMTARPGDWIIRGVKGEIYPCKPDIFAATYEPAVG